MRPSNLQLKNYMVTEINVTANKEFDPGKPVTLGLKDVVTEPQCTILNDNPRDWQICLRMKHSPNTKSNSPYFFTIELVGIFGIEDVVPDDQVGDFARVNGSSVLYSTGREVLRSIMSMGPFLPIMLPTVCFYDSKSKSECKTIGSITEAMVPKAPKKKTPAKTMPSRKQAPL